MGFLNTLFPWGWSCLVHFLVVEMRALYLFYGSVKSFTAKIAISAEMQRQLGGSNGSTDWTGGCVHDHDVDDLLQCVTDGVENALWTLWIEDPTTNNGCYRSEDPGFSYVGALHLSALVVCSLFLLTCLMLLLCSNATDWRAGNYLHFTWELEHKKRYKFGAGVLLTYTAGFLAYVILASFDIIDAQHLFLEPDKLLPLAAVDMFGILFSAYSFLSTSDPPFNWEESKLMDCKFMGRSWLDVVKSSNDSFGDKLEHAILKARLNHPTELETLLGREYDGPLTRVSHLGRTSLGEEDCRLFVALGAMDDQPLEKEMFPDPLSNGNGSGFWACGMGSASSKKLPPQQQLLQQPPQVVYSYSQRDALLAQE